MRRMDRIRKSVVRRVMERPGWQYGEGNRDADSFLGRRLVRHDQERRRFIVARLLGRTLNEETAVEDEFPPAG